MSDPVKSPSHYQVGGFEVWDILDAFFPDDPHLWAAGKYLLRCGRKGDAVQDLEKCQQFLSRAISRRKEEDVSPSSEPRVWDDWDDIPRGVKVKPSGFYSFLHWVTKSHPAGVVKFRDSSGVEMWDFRVDHVKDYGPFTEVIE